MTLPEIDFIGVGPRRTGTTWLDTVLRGHSHISLPRFKETFYFDRNFAEGEEWYRAWFGDGPDRRVGEFGASYFSNPVALDRIHRGCPNLDRLFVTVREPVERAVSHHRHLLAAGRVPENIAEALSLEPEIVRQSQYSVYLRRWRARFGGERIRLVFLENVKDYPDRVIEDVLASLNLEPEEQLGAPRTNMGSYALPRPVESLKRRVLHGLKKRQRFRLIRAGRSVEALGRRLAAPLTGSSGKGYPERNRERLRSILREERRVYRRLRDGAARGESCAVGLDEVLDDS